jgi:tRNA (guanine10-N2)-methyltransferase
MSFKVCVDAFMKKLTMPQKVGKIEKFDFLPLRGPVNLKNPDVFLSLFEYYGSDQVF